MIQDKEMPQTRFNPTGDPVLIDEDENIRRVKEAVKRLTYPQDWCSYNAAQMKEKVLSEQMLIELLESLPDKELKLRGRPGTPLKDRIFSMFIYTYSGLSSRRCISDLQIAFDRKIISFVPHFNSVLNYFSNQTATPVLMKLIYITSLPLRCIETNFAVDSSGFSTSRFERWFNIRTQKVERKRTWKKAHICVGVQSNIITSVTITEGTDPDCPHLIPLAQQTRKFFDMREVSADKAYLSRYNLDGIADIGAIPYVPFKSNSKRNSKGSKMWSRMFDYFLNNRDRFLKSYHRRSNVETTFHMVKRKFGNHLKTKNDSSQVNEILAKCLCHNLAALVHESFELGLDIDLDGCTQEYLFKENNINSKNWTHVG